MRSGPADRPPWAIWPRSTSAVAGETVRASARPVRTGCRAAEAELTEAAAALADGTAAAERRYEVALERFNRLGAGDLDARIELVLDDLGVGAELADRPVATLSGRPGGQGGPGRYRALPFDITLLDEPTNDLDFEGLRRLEDGWGRGAAGMVIVSHDRDFLDRTVTIGARARRPPPDGHRVRRRAGSATWPSG